MIDFRKPIKEARPASEIVIIAVTLAASIITSVCALIPLYLKHGDKIILPAIIIVPLSVSVGAIFIVSLHFSYNIILNIINKLRKYEFLSFILCKIRETPTVFFSNTETKIPAFTRYDCFNFHKYHEEKLTILNKFICINQGQIAQYYYMAGESHKCIKNELKNIDNKLKTMEDKDIDTKKLEEHCNKLKDELPNIIVGPNKIYHKCSEYILKYFAGRSKNNVRICVKSHDQDKNVFDYYRYGWTYRSRAQKYKENKGYSDVIENGKYYLCNDIPKEINKKDYWNPRIYEKQVQKHIDKYGDIDDHDIWCGFWEPFTKNKELITSRPETCYMSTLIVPMTLINNEELIPEFKKHFNIHPIEDGELHRAIYAGVFLSCQHQNGKRSKQVFHAAFANSG